MFTLVKHLMIDDYVNSRLSKNLYRSRLLCPPFGSFATHLRPRQRKPPARQVRSFFPLAISLLPRSPLPPAHHETITLFYIGMSVVPTGGRTYGHQEPITRSEQLPYALVTAFSRTSLFLERFWGKFWISFKFHKPVSKTYKPKMIFFCLLILLSFPFWYLMLRMRSYMVEILLSLEKVP